MQLQLKSQNMRSNRNLTHFLYQQLRFSPSANMKPLLLLHPSMTAAARQEN
jgi:hypothetical protein